MGEDVSAVRRGVVDVIDQRSARRIQRRQIAHALGDLVVGARGVTADAEPTDDLAVPVIERHAATEENQPTGNLLLCATLSRWWRQELRLKQVRLAKAPQRVARLGKGVQH